MVAMTSDSPIMAALSRGIVRLAGGDFAAQAAQPNRQAPQLRIDEAEADAS